MRSSTCAARLPLFQFLAAMRKNPGRALWALLLLAAPSLCLATPAPTSFDNVSSVLATGGVSLNGPTDVAIDLKGNIYIANAGANDIVKVQPDGSAAVLAITGLGTPLNFPACDIFD